MNIPSSISANLMADQSPVGAGARQEYAVSVAVKVQDHIKQEGAAITQLIESAPVPAETSETVGSHLNAVA
ncbi:MAG: hypothetical protein NTU80_05120 [Verrucomicrobia bacterium]|nr:hypothetical protein [Verrucomicrobiota bacterium]